MSNRFLKDALLAVTLALPAANANANSSAIDLEQTELGPTGDHIEVEVAIPALANLVEAKTVTITLQDSADNSSFAAVTGVATVTVTGGTGGGGAALTRTLRLPRTTRRYLRFNAAVEASGGNNTASSVTLALVL